MDRLTHVSENDLIRFADGEVDGKPGIAIDSHLKHCMECRSRLAELKNGADAYGEYHSRVLKPSLQVSEGWPALQFPAPAKRFRFSPLWPIIAATCALAVVAVLFYRDAPRRRATQLLARASAVAPASPHGRLQVTSNGRTWYRPAVLESDTARSAELEATRALFVNASYSWDDPLSARSFAAWRNRLRNKHDQVVSLNSNDGRARFYRVRTDTSDGILRIASLTLRADTLHPVEGRFQFENQEDVIMTDAGQMPAPQPDIASPKPMPSAPGENKVTPEDELRVFAALNAIGADAGEPVNVDVDPSQREVVVSGIGVSSDRQREIRQALAGVPNVTTQFHSGVQSPATKSAAPDTYSNNIAPLRHELEAKAGSAQAFQDLADRALDASSSLVAQVHALSVLAQRFPPSVESQFDSSDEATLTSLRKRHATLIEQAIEQLRTGLAPLLPLPTQQGGSGETRTGAQTSWQAGVDQLLTQSKLLDASLSRLLAGSYSQTAGEDMLASLPDEIKSVENLARAEAAR